MKKQIEDQLAEKAPASIKPFFPCCGGPVATTEKCMCMVPADQQEQAGLEISGPKGTWGEMRELAGLERHDMLPNLC